MNNKLFYKSSKSKKNILIFFTILFIFLFFYIFCIFFTGNSFISDIETIINYETLLRTSSAAIVGFGLSVAGCGMQGVTRNELSGPSTLGILPSATFGIIFSELIQLNKTYFIFIFAFLFAFLSLLINFLSTKSNSKQSYKSVLIGLSIGAFLSSFSYILKSIFPHINENLNMWLGSTSNNYTWERFFYAFPFTIIGILIIIFLRKKINIIEKDINIATCLGINVKNVYWWVGIASILISVSSTLLFGSISILGIVIPHICRMMLKTRDYKVLIPVSGFFSSTVLIVSTLLNKVLQLGINLFILVVFVPIFIFLILLKRKR